MTPALKMSGAKCIPGTCSAGTEESLRLFYRCGKGVCRSAEECIALCIKHNHEIREEIKTGMYAG